MHGAVCTRPTEPESLVVGTHAGRGNPTRTTKLRSVRPVCLVSRVRVEAPVEGPRPLQNTHTHTHTHASTHINTSLVRAKPVTSCPTHTQKPDYGQGVRAALQVDPRVGCCGCGLALPDACLPRDDVPATFARVRVCVCMCVFCVLCAIRGRACLPVCSCLGCMLCRHGHAVLRVSAKWCVCVCVRACVLNSTHLG